MKLIPLLSVVAILTVASCATNTQSTLSSAQRAQVAQIDAALKLVADRRFGEAEGIIQPVIHAKRFNRLPSAEQYRALLTAAKLSFTLKEPKLEYESRVRLLALPEATSNDRISRVNAAARLGGIREMVISLTELVTKNPERLMASDERFVFRVLRDGIKELPHGSMLPLLQALYAAHCKVESDLEPSAAWQDLTLLLLEQNRVAEAMDVSSHVTDEYAVISMRADRRFDAVIAANPAQFDVDAAVKRHLEQFQDAAERAPKSLTPREIVINLLIEQQHYGAALAAADGLVAEIQARNDAKRWYDDFGEQYVWVLDSRSRALRRLGRWDEGIDQLAAASYVADGDSRIVSQVINLGDLYCDLGKPQDALNALVRLGTDISSCGRMQEAYVRLDAAIQLGDAAEKDKWFAFIKEHRVDAPRTYDDALLRMNDSDAAAKWLIERLEDKDMRSGALLSIQDYAVPPETPRQAELRQRRQELIARADVQAEVQKVGRIERYKIEGLGQ